MEIKDIISLVALSIAFLALFIAPWINAKNSKRQVIAPMRQAWINAFRDKVSEFISIISVERTHITPSNSDSEDRKVAAHKEDRERYERLNFLSISVMLHINPKEKKHLELVELLRTIQLGYHDNKDTANDSVHLVKLCQQILKDEWEATKKA